MLAAEHRHAESPVPQASNPIKRYTRKFRRALSCMSVEEWQRVLRALRTMHAIGKTVYIKMQIKSPFLSFWYDNTKGRLFWRQMQTSCASNQMSLSCSLREPSTVFYFFFFLFFGTKNNLYFIFMIFQDYKNFNKLLLFCLKK